MKYYERLKEIREDRDLNQNAIAEVMGITRQQYQLYESGKRKLPIDKLVLFCQTYGISSDYVLGLPKGLKWER